uniref:Olfactory receptor C family, j1 n=1 Tax=Erpetoichthys calabaricus TaxID=27687 RepID=A0A8C4TKI2_ERPCA
MCRIYLFILNKDVLYMEFWKCTEVFNEREFQNAKTMIFAIEEINNNSNLLPGVSLGYKMYDACTSIHLSIKRALAPLNEPGEQPNQTCSRITPLHAVIGMSSTSYTQAVASVFQPFQIPQISYFSTCGCLSDKTKYPTLLRTVSSDFHQSRALAQLVKYFGWNWVGTVRTDNDYGNDGVAAFAQAAQEEGICIEYSVAITNGMTRQNYIKLITLIKQASAKVVLAFLPAVDMKAFLDQLVLENATGLQWVGNLSWMTKRLPVNIEYFKILGGAIGMALPNAIIPGLREYLLNVNPYRDAYSKEFWETTFACSLNTTDSLKVNKCTGSENLRNVNSEYTDEKEFRVPNCIYKAVYAVAHALHNLYTCKTGQGPFTNNTCANNFQTEVLHYLKKVNFTTMYGDHVYFDVNGDPEPRYEIINWQQGEGGLIKYVTVGTYDPSSPQGQQIKMNNVTIIWAGGQTADIEFLSFGEIMGSLLVVISLFGACITMFIILVFFYYRDTPVVRANNSEISFLLLFSLSLCFLCSLTFIGQPSDWSCMLRHTAFGITFALCISCILAKTIVVLMAFRATLPGNNIMKWFGPSQQRLSVASFTLMQVLICLLWLILSPPFPYKNFKYYKERIILECDLGSSVAFYSVLGYIGFLSAICFILAFLARNLPDNFNEAKFITFSMLIFCAVWISFIPAYISSPGKYTVAVEIFAILASSFGLLFCIFAPKCYVIIFKPYKNTKKHLMGKMPSKSL